MDDKIGLTQPMKPEMPEPPPTMAIGVMLTATLLCDFNRYSNGKLLMRISDTDGIVRDDKNKEMGRIGCAIGGTLYVEIAGENGAALYELPTLVLWRAVYLAHKGAHSEAAVDDTTLRYAATLRAIQQCTLTGVEYGDWVQAVVEDALAGRWPECYKCGTAVHDGPCAGEGDDEESRDQSAD